MNTRGIEENTRATKKIQGAPSGIKGEKFYTYKDNKGNTSRRS